MAGACWAGLIVLKFFRSGVGWSDHGALFWILYAPLAVGSWVRDCCGWRSRCATWSAVAACRRRRGRRWRHLRKR
jgi:hypothetical protein